LALPAMIEVKYNDGSIENLPVTWNEADYALAVIGDNVLKGELTLAANTNNTSLLTALFNFKLKKATQLITFLPIGDLVYGQAPLQLQASSISTLPITFEIVSGKATVNQGLMSLTGTGIVIVKASQAGNDVLEPAFVEQSFTISKANLVVAADSLSRILIEPNPELTYTLSGFVYNEDESTLRPSGALSGQPSLTTTAISTSTVGVYPIEVAAGNIAANNYDFSFVDATLTITQNEHVINWNTNGGTTIDPVIVKHGQLLIPAVATREGYTFYAWYIDPERETAYNFDNPTLKDLTLYADWRLLPMPETGPHSLLKIADYMTLLGELSAIERQGPIGMKLLTEKSHLADKTLPMKLSNWKGYGQLKKAIVKTKPASFLGSDLITGGVVLSETDALITERGVCWSTTVHPTMDDEKLTENGSDFNVTISQLTPGITYYMRAYAISSLGISYGNEVSIIIP
jgi:uncharacterized repeat protein (TIGR02543 family)